ncbi:MAG: hypothetical protein ACOC11_03510, partial [Prolixibacteraceae bacterium]
MNKKEIEFRKTRELGEIINDSFEFLKLEIRPLSKLIIRYVLPFALVYGGLQIYVQMKVIGRINFSNPESLLGNMGPVYLNVLLASLFAVFVQSLLVGTYYSYLEAYIRKGKGNIEPEDITDVLFSNTLVALGANLVVYFITLIGVIMCILPGIYFANSLSLVVMVLFMEKKKLPDALTRTWKLVHSQWWNTFMINVLGLVIIYAAGFIVTLPAAIGGYGFASDSNGIETPGFPSFYWFLQGLSAVVSVLLWIIPFTFLAFQYFNLRERNES